MRSSTLRCVTFAVCLVPAWASAQSASVRVAPPQPLTLEQALQYAVEHYPTVRAALEQVDASSAGVDAARTAYLPRLDSIWQSNLATTNNVFGQVLPQSVIPALSGPVCRMPLRQACGAARVKQAFR